MAGTTIGREHRRWLVSALGFELEMELAPLMAFFRYDDVPGVIGRIGTLFGEAGVNIANMAVSRTKRGREGADGAVDRHRPGRSSSSAARRRARRRLLDHARRGSRQAVAAIACCGDRRLSLLDDAVTARRGSTTRSCSISSCWGAIRKRAPSARTSLVVARAAPRWLAARRVGALADERGVLLADLLGRVCDPLVGVAERGLRAWATRAHSLLTGVSLQRSKWLWRFA